MKFLLVLILWALLLVLCAPVAVLALIALVKAILFLPARILGHKESR